MVGGFSELLPRSVLVDEAVRNKRVLEAGVADLSTLVRLSERGAARIAGTTLDAGRFPPARLREKRIELHAMGPGRLDFEDAAFDVVLVPDLFAAIEENPRFLEELRRVVHKDGFSVLSWQARGSTFADLVRSRNGDQAPSVLSSERTVGAIEAARRLFRTVRLFRQTPFVGVAILAEALDPAEAAVSLDGTFAQDATEPSHLILVCGVAQVLPEDRTLVELSFGAFSALAQEAKNQALEEHFRLERALEQAQAAIAERDESLRQLGERMRPIRNALEKRLFTKRRDPHPLVEDLEARPPAIEPVEVSGLKRALAEEKSTVASLSEQLLLTARDKHTRDQKISELSAHIRTLELSQPNPEDVDQRDKAEQAGRDLVEAQNSNQLLVVEIARLKELERLQRQRLAETEERASENAEHERRDRLRSADLAEAGEVGLRQLERTSGVQEERIYQLERELESQLLVQHSLGTDYRDAESRINYLQARLDEQALARAQEVRDLAAQIAVLTSALNEADRSQDRLRARLEELDAGAQTATARLLAAERVLEVARQHLAAERAISTELRAEADEARRSGHVESEDLRRAARALADRENELAALKESVAHQEQRGAALEIAASEVTSLKARVQELRWERDTLAAASELILKERDTAAELAKKALFAEQENRTLGAQLRQSDAENERQETEIERLVLALEAVRASEDEQLAHRLALNEDQSRLNLQLLESGQRAEGLDRALEQARARVRALDQQLAGAEAERAASARRNESSALAADGLEALLRETNIEARELGHELGLARKRIAQLEIAQAEHEQLLGQALSRRALAEAESAEARGLLAVLQSGHSRAMAEVSFAKTRLEVLERKLKDSRKAGSQIEQDRDHHAQALLAAEAREQVLLREKASLARELEATKMGRDKTLEEALQLSQRLAQAQSESVMVAGAGRFVNDRQESGRNLELVARLGLVGQVLDDSRLRSLQLLEAHEEAKLSLLLTKERLSRAEAEVRRAKDERDELASALDRIGRPIRPTQLPPDRDLDAHALTLAKERAHRAEIELRQLAASAKEREALILQDLDRVVRDERSAALEHAAFEKASKERERALRESAEQLAQRGQELQRQQREQELAFEEQQQAQAELVARLVESGDHALALERELEGRGRAIAGLQSKLLELRGELASRLAENEEGARRKLGELESRLAERDRAVENLRAANAEAAAHWVSLESDQRAVELEFERRSAAFAERAQTLAAETAALKEEQKSLSARLLEERRISEGATGELAALREEQRVLSTKLREERETLDRATQEAGALKAQLDVVSAEVTELREAEERTKAETALEHERIQRVVEHQQLGAQASARAIESLQKERDRARAELASVRQGAQQLGELSRTLAERAEKSESRLAAEQQNREEAQMLARELELQRAELIAELDQIRSSPAPVGPRKSIPPAGRSADLPHPDGVRLEVAEKRLLEVEGKLAEADSRQRRAEAERSKLKDLELAAEARSQRAEERADRAEKEHKLLQKRASEAEVRLQEATQRAHQAELNAGKLEEKGRALETRTHAAELRALEVERRLHSLAGSTPVDGAAEPSITGQASSEDKTPGGGRPTPPARPSFPPGPLNAADSEQLREELRRAWARLAEASKSGPIAGIAAGLKARCDSLEATITYRDEELARLRRMHDKIAQDLDDARADVGRKLQDLRGAQDVIEQKERELLQRKDEAAIFAQKLARQGDAKLLAEELRKRDQDLERAVAQKAALEREVQRFRELVERSEQGLVQLEMRIAELESVNADARQREALLVQERDEQADRLRRLTGRPE